MNTLATFKYENLLVETFYKGTDEIDFKISLDGEIIIEDSMRPSPMNNIDDIDVMLSIISFSKLDSKLDSFWEDNSELDVMMTDYYEKDNETFLEEHEMTYEFCTRIEKYHNI